MANRLSLMTTAGATVATIDLDTGESVERPAPEDERRTPRGLHVGGGGGAQSQAAGTHRIPRGSLVLRLSSAHRATFHDWMDDYLTTAHRLRHIPDTVGAPGTHTTWKLFGTQTQEDWSWVEQSDFWRLLLSVVDVSDVI